jgi:nickel-dependent lactate racemase
LKEILIDEEWNIDPGIKNRIVELKKEITIETEDPELLIERRLKDFIETMGIESFQGEDVGIIINDTDRPTPSYFVLEELIRSIPDLPGRVSRVYIATGSHRPSTDDDLRSLLGGSYSIFKEKVLIHDNSAVNDHSHFGTTSRGTEVLIQSSLEDHDNIILINSVEPHYFAGFTGGRKSIFPGLAAYESIEHNHSFALDDKARAMELQGNPVHEDMMEAVNLFMKNRNHVSFQMVQGPEILLLDVVIGELGESFEKAVSISRDVFSIPIDKPYDIVVSRAKKPMDRTLYQAQKALENGKLALRKDGIIILVASLDEGIGRAAFWNLLTSRDDPSRILEEIENGYKLGYHKAAKMVKLTSDHDVLVVSNLSPDVLSKGYMEGFEDPDSALKEALKRKGEDASILYIPDGTVTVPELRRETDDRR